MSRRRFAPLLATTVTATAALTTSVVVTTGPTQAATSPLRYVALGDSYSAASGVLPPDPTSPLCARSTANYPHLIAAATGAQLTDVTCGAAQTKDFATSQYPGVAPQLDAVHRRTQLVTMTIGGNDNNTFIGAIVAVRRRRAVDARPGQPVPGPVRRLVRRRHPDTRPTRRW